MNYMQATESGIVAGSREDRAVGALVGLAVGDALGAPVEFKRRGSFHPVRGMRAGGPFNLKAGEWTDDTSMSLALGEALLEDPLLDDPASVMSKWSAWRNKGAYSHTGTCFDIGLQTTTALQDWSRTGKLPAASDAAGNGCVMRLAPVALRWYDVPSNARRIARRQTRYTHNNETCQEGTRT